MINGIKIFKKDWFLPGEYDKFNKPCSSTNCHCLLIHRAITQSAVQCRHQINSQFNSTKCTALHMYTVQLGVGNVVSKDCFTDYITSHFIYFHLFRLLFNFFLTFLHLYVRCNVFLLHCTVYIFYSLTTAS